MFLFLGSVYCRISLFNTMTHVAEKAVTYGNVGGQLATGPVTREGVCKEGSRESTKSSLIEAF